jgi:hypothetical protein
VTWLGRQYAHGMGGVLADDMVGRPGCVGGGGGREGGGGGGGGGVGGGAVGTGLVVSGHSVTLCRKCHDHSATALCQQAAVTERCALPSSLLLPLPLLHPLLHPVQGLGKTLQAIALVAALLGKTGDQRDLLPAGRRYGSGAAAGLGGARWPLLVVAPSSVLENWQREFQRWGSFRVSVVQGRGGGWVGGWVGGVTHPVQGADEQRFACFNIFTHIACPIHRTHHVMVLEPMRLLWGVLRWRSTRLPAPSLWLMLLRGVAWRWWWPATTCCAAMATTWRLQASMPPSLMRCTA